jgi:GNAT superfamily N-acetyltransferase
MPETVVRTCLELVDPARLRPAPAPALDGLRIARRTPPDGAVSRWFYVAVGRHHSWTDHLGRTGADWQRWAERVETWVATVDGDRAGYFELRPDGASAEVAFLGLLPAYQGRGLGGYLVTRALGRALELAPRVWLHTCTLDGEHALSNYLARGMRPFRRVRIPRPARHPNEHLLTSD